MSAMTTKPAHKAGGRTGIIAGGGLLPIQIAEALADAGEEPFIVAIRGEVDESSPLLSYPHGIFDLEQFGLLVPTLKRERVSRLVMAGKIGRRPKLTAFRPILPLLPSLPRIAVDLAKGDDAVLRFVVRHLERGGVSVVGAHEILPNLLVGHGVHTRRKPAKTDLKDIDAAFAATKAIGALDIGQAAIAIGGRTIALEGIEGTDGLLERVAALRGHGRLAGRKGGVLVKSSKPGQEMRADLPGIGVQTVENAHAAGLNGIAVEAELTLALDFKGMIALADDLGLFVVGLSHEGRL